MRKYKMFFYILGLLIMFTLPFKALSADIKQYDYKVINSYPHDRNAFTQGLEFYKGYLYEGTGLNGQSSLRKVNLKDGKIIKKQMLADKYFGEGITIYKDNIYQLTWKSGIGFIYNLDFKLINKFTYNYQGWGLTHNKDHLIVSDGTNTIRFLDPQTLEVVRKIKVTKNNKKVININELEYIKGKIYANIWQKNYIVIINPENGRITAIVDLEKIINPKNYDYNLNVLNGIAYDSENDRLFVTGKLWPKIFEIKIIKKD